VEGIEMKKIVRMCAFILAIVLMTSFITSCGKSGKTVSNNDTPETETVTIRYMTWTGQTEYNKDDNIIKKIMKDFNCDFEFITAPYGGSYTDMATMQYASGEIPDIMKVATQDYKTISELYKSGYTLNFDSYMNDNKYPNLKAYMEEARPTQNFSGYNGEFTYLPMQGDYYYHNLYVRQDWLDTLSLSAPKTMQDLETVCKAFIGADINGKKTTGFTTGGMWWLYHFISCFTGTWEFCDKNGKIMPNFGIPEMDSYFTFMQQFYTEKCLDQELFTMDENAARNKFMTGRAGFFLGQSNYSYYNEIKSTLTQNFPDAKISLIKMPEGPAGSHQVSATPFASEMTVVNGKSKVKERVLKIMDYILSSEGQNLITNGIEGIHYTKNSDGTLVRNNDAYVADKFNTEQQAQHIFGDLVKHNKNIPTTIPDFEINKQNVNNLNAWAKEGYFISQPLGIQGYTSDIGSKYLPKYYEIRDRWHVEFVSGKKPATKANFESFRAELDKNGYQELVNDMTDYSKK
jgi:ABC-type glycerol-3-phosphate transport system substrate-binding protein